MRKDESRSMRRQGVKGSRRLLIDNEIPYLALNDSRSPRLAKQLLR